MVDRCLGTYTLRSYLVDLTGSSFDTGHIYMTWNLDTWFVLLTTKFGDTKSHPVKYRFRVTLSLGLVISKPRFVRLNLSVEEGERSIYRNPFGELKSLEVTGVNLLPPLPSRVKDPNVLKLFYYLQTVIEHTSNRVGFPSTTTVTR